MCGIAGILQRKVKSNSRAIVEAMLSTISHRGPDDSGIYSQSNMAIGNRRLSIIDLSPSGHQPMSDKTSQVWITYNGEIYNYKSLKKELIGLGHCFHGSSDTEVVLYSYIQWGDTFVSRLIGMFAIAIWDNRVKSLFLARDHLGIKPLFYADTPEGFAFGSEIKTVLCSSVVKPRLDVNGLSDCLAFASVIAPRTMFLGIMQLPPAHAAWVCQEDTRIWSYWTPLNKDFGIHSHRQWQEDLYERLIDAVKGCLQSDVDVGVFLSSGIDSNAIAYIMSHELNRSGPTFTMGFDEASFDESSIAITSSRQYKMTPYVEKVPVNELSEQIGRIVWHSEEPTPNPSFVATWYLAKLASSHVKVAISGDGGDELFGGYETYFASLAAEKLNKFLPRGWLKIFSFLADALPTRAKKRSLEDSIQRFAYGTIRPDMDRHGIWRIIVRKEEIDTLLMEGTVMDEVKGRDPIRDAYGKAINDAINQSELNRMLYADTTVYLPNDGLVKMDRMGMAHGIEIRVPLLNHDLVEYAFAMPEDLKFSPLGGGKIALKRILRGKLSNRILKARKMGFNAPAASWISGPLRQFVLDTLSYQTLKADGLFNPKAVHDKVRQHLGGKKDYSSIIWLALCVTIWYGMFIGPNKVEINSVNAGNM